MRWVILFILALSLVAAQECVDDNSINRDNCASQVSCGCTGILTQAWENQDGVCPEGQGYCKQTSECSVSTDEFSCTDNVDNNCNGLIDCQEDSCSTNSYCIDADGDGESALTDCDDNNPAINSGIANNPATRGIS